jgi:transposase-like protein
LFPLGKPKYNRGRRGKTTWVVGGIERGTKKCFVEIVADRSADTLLSVIEWWVAPGTRVMTDGWQGYNHIRTIQNGIYTHDVVVHDTHFVHPACNDIHTQSVEGMWSRVKHVLKKMRGTSSDLLSTYLAEFMWRESLEDNCVFNCILFEISQQYQV